MTRLILLGLAAYLLAVAFFLSRAEAQEMTSQPGGPHGIGVIRIENKTTPKVERVRRFDFEGVEVVVHYESTPNAVVGVDPRDIITVTAPDGYIAIPSEVLLPEGEAIEIVIYEALLG